MIKLHIFDVDGTILDSHQFWSNVIGNYLKEKNIIIPSDAEKILTPMGFSEAVSYIKEKFLYDISYDEIFNEINNIIIRYYTNDVMPFNDMLSIIDELVKAGEKLVIYTNSNLEMVKPALIRINIFNHFEHIFTPEKDSIGYSKNNPIGFRFVCDKMNVSPTEAILYDDADYALKAASSIGIKTKSFNPNRSPR